MAKTFDHIAKQVFQVMLRRKAPEYQRTWHMKILQQSIPGWSCEGNVACFDYAMRNLPSSSPVVEIGTFCGLSTNMLIYMKKRHGIKNTVITCDKWQFTWVVSGGVMDELYPIPHEEYCRFIEDSYVRNTNMFSRDDIPFTIKAFSDEFFTAWANSEQRIDLFGRNVKLGGPISFCYIDGNHSYEYAKRDFENADKYLENGGFLLFDDSGDFSGWDVCKVVKEVKATGRYKLIAKDPNYFFQKKV
jgi:hypothetical protein